MITWASAVGRGQKRAYVVPQRLAVEVEVADVKDHKLSVLRVAELGGDDAELLVEVAENFAAASHQVHDDKLSALVEAVELLPVEGQLGEVQLVRRQLVDLRRNAPCKRSKFD